MYLHNGKKDDSGPKETPKIPAVKLISQKIRHFILDDLIQLPAPARLLLQIDRYRQKTHLEKLIRQFHFSFANHNSRITLCKFGATGLIYYTTKKVYKIDHDFIELAESEMAAAKKYSRGESYGLFSCGKRTFENHLQNALSNRKLMISVIGGPVTDSEEAANFFEEESNGTLYGFVICLVMSSSS
ncbi:hypothetical protein Y032_0202g1792 [Ancylostoma ceylanicum]|uniref:Uncharacterized protein n=1 Tax=Ancylostoma ceylanicum TaxID=53326 RepID=A0A016SN27_9BILA|nr:hypothetical protein Y032_0202g1792 [Ancylostoma ceylanicum]